MLKNIVVPAPVAVVAKAALLACLIATSSASQAQTTYYRNSPGQSTTTERNYSYSTWASSSFIGSGYIQSNADEETAYAYWKYSSGGFQCAKGLRAIPEGPDQLWYARPSQMVYTNGKGTATFSKSLNPRNVPSGSQIWSGVLGWLEGIEFYIVESLDRGGLPLPASTKVGSVTIDGSVYDLYTRPYQTWRQWWSVRRGNRDSGTVNYVKHFKAWQGISVTGMSGLVNSASIKLPDVSLLHVTLGVETYGPSEASIYWATSSITKPYN